MPRGFDQHAQATSRVLMRLIETPGPLDTPCWVWPGARSRDGYGYIRVGGTHGKILTVHALLYRTLTGRRPRRGQHVHHRCGIGLCANPDHLEAVTRLQHGSRHRLDVARCGHPFDRASGRHRYCGRCRNARRRTRYAEAHA